MILLLLDTNAYLRIAKRVKPLLGVAFGQKDYQLTILEDVEREFQRSPRLQINFPWFQDGALQSERLAKRFRLSRD
ncbi:DNA-binding protein, partial [Salmonella enterica subsp. enterica serovar Weltevreden]|nr:DNA-binding protein [Salmonella enterica subsp. enterica serovar Weltevreden]